MSSVGDKDIEVYVVVTSVRSLLFFFCVVYFYIRNLLEGWDINWIKWSWIKFYGERKCKIFLLEWGRRSLEEKDGKLYEKNNFY